MLWSKLPTENDQGIKENIDMEDLTVDIFIETVKKTTKNEDVEQQMIYKEFCVSEERKKQDQRSTAQLSVTQFQSISIIQLVSVS